MTIKQTIGFACNSKRKMGHNAKKHMTKRMGKLDLRKKAPKHKSTKARPVYIHSRGCGGGFCTSGGQSIMLERVTSQPPSPPFGVGKAPQATFSAIEIGNYPGKYIFGNFGPQPPTLGARGSGLRASQPLGFQHIRHPQG